MPCKLCKRLPSSTKRFKKPSEKSPPASINEVISLSLGSIPAGRATSPSQDVLDLHQPGPVSIT